MSNAVKSKFAGFFRGLWGRGEEQSAESPSSAPRPVTAATTPGAAPATVRVQAAAQSAPLVSTTPSADELALPVAPIIAGLPMELRAKIMSVPPPGRTSNIAVEIITSQLAFGAQFQRQTGD